MVGSNIDAFCSEVSEFMNTLIPKELSMFHRALVLETLTRVVEKTPVDTGYARGNWQIGVNESIDYPIEGIEDSSRGGGDNNTIASNLAKIADLPPFSVVYISNNVDYISYLEEGHSGQARDGMVSVTIDELRNWFKDAVI